MTHVFLLWHTQEDADLPGGEDVKLLGVYSSRQKAEEALNASVTLPGFSDQPAGFLITPYELDDRAWIGGYFMV